MTDPIKHCIVHNTEGCAHVDGFLCDMETCSIRIKYLESIERGATEISKEMDSILMKAVLRSSKIVDRGRLIENIKAGAERNTDNSEGYSEGTREAYEEFVKKRNYKIGGN